MKGLKLIQKGLMNPGAVPHYLANKISPTHWRDGNQVRFVEGGYVTHAKDRAEFAASLHYEVDLLQDAIGENVGSSFELGCGYGRLSPWIAEFSDEHTAVDFDIDALERARQLYPEIRFVEMDATELNFSDGAFDLAVTWTVLHHIPNEIIKGAIEELKRIVGPDGRIVIAELVAGKENKMTWIRSEEQYEELFSPFEIQKTLRRRFHYRDSDYESKVMVFER
ncbi:class I SAM-dependent methyltransferase [Haladaptatus sp. DYSN1]|uniref:class I SAM-dependent methyltransferase n=1 Tax=unclassified Haladaptatus TaxID=2622732 RepID=UPI0024061CB6|nr:class I SAM-dependent methyltransferase [Haladaptatus sp. DYSN1]